MSDSIDLERLRKEAKTVLKQCRSGDAAAIGRVRRQLPRLASLEAGQLPAQIKLADVTKTPRAAFDAAVAQLDHRMRRSR